MGIMNTTEQFKNKMSPIEMRLSCMHNDRHKYINGGGKFCVNGFDKPVFQQKKAFAIEKTAEKTFEWPSKSGSNISFTDAKVAQKQPLFGSDLFNPFSKQQTQVKSNDYFKPFDFGKKEHSKQLAKNDFKPK